MQKAKVMIDAIFFEKVADWLIVGEHLGENFKKQWNCIFVW